MAHLFYSNHLLVKYLAPTPTHIYQLAVNISCCVMRMLTVDPKQYAVGEKTVTKG